MKKRKTLKIVLSIIVVLIVSTMIFQGVVYRNLVAYDSVGTRTNYEITNQKIIQLIEEKTTYLKEPTIEEIVQLSVSITCQQLYFTDGKSDTNPNLLFQSKAANCVGYATFCAAICNHLIHKYALDNEWTAKIQIGHLFLAGNNIHQFFESSFFKDHDFVTIENRISKEILAVDPTLDDYFYINSVTLMAQGDRP